MGKLVHHHQHAEAVTINILILNKVVGPDVVGIGRCQRQRALTALPSTFWSLVPASALASRADARACD